MLMDLIEERREAATRYLNAEGFDATSQNGQRISTQRAVAQLNLPEQEYSEIFIGKLPRDLFEDELLPVLQQVGGTIKKIRLMMDFSGFNRGFGFVKFATTAEAARACKLLDGLSLRPNTEPIGARISFDNKCLYFGNLPRNCTAEQLVVALRKVDIPGIKGARMADEDSPSSSPRGSPRNSPPISGSRRGAYGRTGTAAPRSRYCHVYFESHDAATAARRMLLPGEVKIFKRTITCDWAKSVIPNEIAEQVRNPIVNSILSKQPQFPAAVAQQYPQLHHHQQQHQLHQLDEYQYQCRLKAAGLNYYGSDRSLPASSSGSLRRGLGSCAAAANELNMNLFEQNMRSLRTLLPTPLAATNMKQQFCTQWDPINYRM